MNADVKQKPTCGSSPTEISPAKNNLFHAGNAKRAKFSKPVTQRGHFTRSPMKENYKHQVGRSRTNSEGSMMIMVTASRQGGKQGGKKKSLTPPPSVPSGITTATTADSVYAGFHEPPSPLMVPKPPKHWVNAATEVGALESTPASKPERRSEAFQQAWRPTVLPQHTNITHLFRGLLQVEA